MNTKILLALIMIGILFACSKNTYNTKPTLLIKSLDKKFVKFDESLSIQLQVTDKEGDVTDSLFLRKIFLNKKKTPLLANDSLHFKIPDAPNYSDGVVQVDLAYNNYLITAINPNGPGSVIYNDTIIFKFVLKDKANNVSDTVTTEPIVIERR